MINKVIPDSLETLFMNNATIVRGVVLPKDMDFLSLNSLEDFSAITLPEKVNVLCINGKKDTKDLKLPEITKRLELNGLQSLDGFIFPHMEDGSSVSFDGVRIVQNFVFPEELGDISLKNAILFKNVKFTEALLSLDRPKLQYYEDTKLPLTLLDDDEKENDYIPINRTK